MKTFELRLMNDITLTRVKRKRDAQYVYCRECNWLLSDVDNPYWSINKSAWLHENGIGHKMIFLGYKVQP